MRMIDKIFGIVCKIFDLIDKETRLEKKHKNNDYKKITELYFKNNKIDESWYENGII